LKIQENKTEVVKLSLEHCRTFYDVAKEKGLHFIAIMRLVGKMAWYLYTSTGSGDMREENAQAITATEY
jgi:hypothetical protein